MTQSPAQIPRIPVMLSYPLRTIPFAPLSIALTAYSRKIAKSNPGLANRLGEYSHTRFVLDPTDLPFVIYLDPNGGIPRVNVVRGPGEGPARIAGPLAALLGLVHGVFDGDALFFSRDLVVEGDTAATLALRNAVDNAGLDLSQEFLHLSGPLANALRRVLSFVQRRTGVSLIRPEEVEA